MTKPPVTLGKFSTAVGTWTTLVILVVAQVVARAADTPNEDAYQSVWTSLSELLRRREYGSANGLLEAAAEDPELQYRGKLIEADKAIVAGLMSLQRAVTEQASQLPEGTPLQISGLDYTLVRYDKDLKGNSLVLKSKAGGNESRKRVDELPASTWMQLAESHLDSLEHPELILGVFVGFDRVADSQAARKLLNQAASKGADVTTWLARLDRAEAEKKLRVADRKSSDDDPLVGHWRQIFGKGDREVISNSEFRSNGVALRTVSPQSLPKLKKKKIAPPSLVPTKGTWQKQDDGTYRITYADGATLQITVAGDRFWGKSANGTPVSGTRQVTKTK